MKLQRIISALKGALRGEKFPVQEMAEAVVKSTRTRGRIRPNELLREVPKLEKAFPVADFLAKGAKTVDEFLVLINQVPHKVARGRVRRNGPCPCGSGQKFKTCHLEAVRAGEIAPVRFRLTRRPAPTPVSP